TLQGPIFKRAQVDFETPPIVHQPAIHEFSPHRAASGETVTITGSYFKDITNVAFGGIAVSSFVVVNEKTITAVVGAGKSGKIEVTSNAGKTEIAGFEYYTKPVEEKGTMTVNFEGNTYNYTEFTAGYKAGENSGWVTGSLPWNDPGYSVTNIWGGYRPAVGTFTVVEQLDPHPNPASTVEIFFGQPNSGRTDYDYWFNSGTVTFTRVDTRVVGTINAKGYKKVLNKKQEITITGTFDMPYKESQ
ncbi:MAG: hypothetical protein EOP48_11535, partial [Sphingobacteriales bacterium]